MAGAERVVVEIVKSLKESSSHSHVIEVASLSGREPPLPIAVRQRGLFAILFGRYDVIHSHLFLPGLVVRLRRIFDKTFVWIHTVHYCSYQGQKWPLVKRILDEHCIFPTADHLVAVSRQTYKGIRKYPNAEMIENALELKDKTSVCHARKNRPFTIGSVAMLRSEKGLDDLILAMKAVTQVLPEATLRIAGDGPELKSLISLTRKLQLQDNIEFCGFVEDIDNFLASLDMYVNPAKTESFGMAVLEAMQFSLPIVATAVGANSDVLGNGSFGVLVPRGEAIVKSLTEAILEISKDTGPGKKRSHLGLQYYSGRLKIGVMVEKYRALLERSVRPGVCMICPVVTHSTGGLQRQIWLQSRELTRLGYRVFLLQRQDRLKKTPAEWSHVDFLSTPNPFANWHPDSSFAHRIRGIVFIIAGFVQICRHRHRISVLHAHQLYSPTLIGVAAKLLLGKALVVKVTASGFLGESRELKKLPFFRLRRMAFKHIDRLIVLSEEMRLEMLDLGFDPQRIALVPNGVELPNLNAERTLKKDFDAPFRILYCGRLSSEKCLSDLIEAAAQVGRSGLACEVHLVGGSYGGRDVTESLKRLASSVESDTRVIFHGNQKQVAPFYLSADVFVLPSVSEGMSNALLEALSYGIPCVVSDIVPNRSLVEDRVNGLCFRQGDIKDLADKLSILARDRQAGFSLGGALGESARKSIEIRFSSRVIGAKISEIYRQIMAAPVAELGV